jgi:hypothetical protein
MGSRIKCKESGRVTLSPVLAAVRIESFFKSLHLFVYGGLDPIDVNSVEFLRRQRFPAKA